MQLLGGDPDKDVAVLKLQAPNNVLSNLKPITVGTSANLQVGQKVFAVGNPFGLDHSMSQGIISGLGRELAVPSLRQVPIRNAIQTDAAINPGNSGGVLLDSRGRLIGINTAIADPSGPLPPLPLPGLSGWSWCLFGVWLASSDAQSAGCAGVLLSTGLCETSSVRRRACVLLLRNLCVPVSSSFFHSVLFTVFRVCVCVCKSVCMCM